MEEIMKHVEEQLLQSDFTDSMLAGTGFPPGIITADEAFLAAELKVVIGDASVVGGRGAGAFVQSPAFGPVLVLDVAPAETARIAALAAPEEGALCW